MDLGDLKERAVNFVLTRVQSYANRNVDIEDLQERHNAVRERVGRIELRDLDRIYHFRVKDGELEFLNNPQKVDGGVRTDSDTLICLARGERNVMDPATGEERTEEYTPIDAMTRGDLQPYGDAVTNDVLLFAKALYEDVYPDVKNEIRGEVDRLQHQEGAGA